MSINKEFTFTKKQENGRLHAPKVCKAAKEYKGACEHCSSDIHKGTFVLTADEVVSVSHGFGVRTVKTHRLCARCTAEYIASTSTPPVDDTKGESMKFDKSKILTVVTADQARIGQKGWFAVLPKYIQENMSGYEPSVLSDIDLDSPSPFTREGGYAWPLFYPAPEPTYAERQAQWVKENNVEEGTKVRVTRAFTENEDGCYCWKHDDLVGMTGVVSKYGIGSRYLAVDMSNGSMIAVPYFALEVIKEPTYRPFKNAEEFKPYRDKWLRHGGVIFQHDGYYDCGILIGNERFSWKEMFKSFVFEDGTPYGVKI